MLRIWSKPSKFFSDQGGYCLAKGLVYLLQVVQVC